MHPPDSVATAPSAGERLEAVRQTPGFRVAAVLICGIGLATAGTAALRAVQAWNEPGRPVRSAGPLPARPIATPAPSPAATAPLPPGIASGMPVPAATAPEADPATMAAASQPVAGAAPTSDVSAPPVSATPSADMPKAIAAVPTIAAPPAPGAPAGTASRASVPATDGREQRLRKTAAVAKHTRESTTPFREETAPVGSAPGVRTFRLSERAGRTDASGVRVIELRVP